MKEELHPLDCPICNCFKSIIDNNYKIDCLQHGKYSLTANVIKDWLTERQPTPDGEIDKKIATKYIMQNREKLITSDDIYHFKLTLQLKYGHDLSFLLEE